MLHGKTKMKRLKFGFRADLETEIRVTMPEYVLRILKQRSHGLDGKAEKRYSLILCLNNYNVY